MSSDTYSDRVKQVLQGAQNEALLQGERVTVRVLGQHVGRYGLAREFHQRLQVGWQ